MAQSIRYVIRGVKGRVRCNRNWSAIRSRQSVVTITAGEVIHTEAGANTIPFPDQHAQQNFIYNLGDANVWVSNVSPHQNDHFPGELGGVEFILNVDFNAPLDVAVTITVDDQLPLAIDGF